MLEESTHPALSNARTFRARSHCSKELSAVGFTLLGKQLKKFSITEKAFRTMSHFPDQPIKQENRSCKTITSPAGGALELCYRYWLRKQSSRV